MPTAGRPNQHFRIDDETWERFGETADKAGIARSVLLRAFIAWYLHDAELPERPESD